LDEQVGDHAIFRRDDGGAVHTVAIENPTREKKGSPFVRLAERLSPRDAKHQNRCGVDTFLNFTNRCECTIKSFEIVGFIEPLVLFSN
jgi:hypothetical protein